MDFSEIITEYGLYLAYILMAVAVLSAIILPFLNALTNPKALLRTLGGVVILAAVFVIAYAVSSGEVLRDYEEMGVRTAGASKFVGGTLLTTYFLFIFAIIAIAVSEIRNVFK